MSDSVPPSQPSESSVTAPAVATPEAGAGKPAAPGRFVPRGKRARWVTAGAVAVVVVGGVTAVAVAEHDHHGRMDRGPRIALSGPGHEGGLRVGTQEAGPRHQRG
ncbi:hypothetical protein ACWGE1_35915, partial [Streptomyces sp. NPDC054932]